MLNSIKTTLLQNAKKISSNDVFLDSPGSDFIPYACHYTKDSILTKNGELLQTIKIAGASHEILGKNKISMREVIRQAIGEKIQSNKFSLCFHTIRKRVNLDTNPKFPGFLQDELHKAWVSQNKWDSRFVNELYITIICAGLPIKINIKNFSKMFFTSSLVKEHDIALENNYKELNSLTHSLQGILSSYGAKKLELIFDEKIGYSSELLSFFTNIIRLENESIPLKKEDLSKQLSEYQVAFGNNALEVKNKDKKFFARMLTLKNCHNISDRAIDKFLQIQEQLVITQTMNFVPTHQSLDKHSYQDYVLNVSGDMEFKEISGLNKVFTDQNIQSDLSCCETQVIIMVIADTLEILDSSVFNVASALSNIGVPVIVEDLNMEHCFWSQLPANFAYITRKRTILTSMVGSFASLYNFPFGSLRSKWGEYLTLLKTNLGTTYFFNFHVGDNGHTIIIGDAYSGKKTLLNFLLSEASKLNPKVLHLDSFNESKLYIDAIGGTYKVFSFDPKENNIKFNPLLIDDNEENREYLKYWFLYLLDKYADPSDIEQYMAPIESAVHNMFSLPQNERKLSSINKMFSDPQYDDLNKKIIENLGIWYGDGKLAHIFDNDIDELIENEQNYVMSIDMTSTYDTPMSLNLPVINYILYYFKTYYTGKTPSILAVADGNRVFNSIYFEKNFSYILDDLQKNNSIMLITASFSSEKVNWSAVVGGIYNEKMATKIFLSDGASLANINQIFQLSDIERMYLEAFDIGTRQFILRQGEVSIVSVIDISDFEVSLGILSNDKKQVKLAESLQSQYGNDPNKWLPALYECTENQEV